MHLLASLYNTQVKAGVNRLLNCIGTATLHCPPPAPNQLRLLTPWRIPLEQFTTLSLFSNSFSCRHREIFRWPPSRPVPPPAHILQRPNEWPHRRLAKLYVNCHQQHVSSLTPNRQAVQMTYNASVLFEWLISLSVSSLTPVQAITNTFALILSPLHVKNSDLLTKNI
jgi:hypothetical protein